jgi:hypothetical protein
MKENALGYTFLTLGALALVVLLTIIIAAWHTIVIASSVLVWVVFASGCMCLAGGSLWLLSKGFHAAGMTIYTMVEKHQAIRHTNERHELDKHLAISRMPADALGNYPILLKSSEQALIHAMTFAPGNSPVKQARIKEVTGTLAQLPAPGRDEIPGKAASPFGTSVLVPTLAEQIEQQDTIPGEPESILGYALDGGPRRGPWNKLHSFFVAGGSGSGKSSTVAYYAALAVLHNARLLLIDPDAAEEESITRRLSPLSPFLLAPVGNTPQSALRVVEIANQEMEEPGSYPIVLIVDEFSTIMRHGKLGGLWSEAAQPIASCLEEYAQRGRKRNRTAIVIGQIAKASRTGGTELRASMTATFVHRIKPQQARLMLDPEEADQCEYLEPGEALVLLTNAVSTYRMRIPYADLSDMMLVAQLMRPTSGRKPNRETSPALHVLRHDDDDELVETCPQPARNLVETSPATAWEAKVARVRELRSQSRTQKQILYQVWGVTPGGNAAYVQARDEYQQIVKLLNAEEMEA